MLALLTSPHHVRIIIFFIHALTTSGPTVLCLSMNIIDQPWYGGKLWSIRPKQCRKVLKSRCNKKYSILRTVNGIWNWYLVFDTLPAILRETLCWYNLHYLSILQPKILLWHKNDVVIWFLPRMVGGWIGGSERAVSAQTLTAAQMLRCSAQSSRAHHTLISHHLCYISTSSWLTTKISKQNSSISLISIFDG